MRFNSIVKYAITFITGSIIYTNTLASGLQIWEQSATGLGDYHAGGAAEASDASTQWYNPAGLANLTAPEISIGGVLVNTKVPYNGTVSVSSIQNTISDPTNYTPNVSANGGTLTAIPNIQFAYPITDRFAVGFGIVVPFGMVTNYGTDTFLQYVTTKTQIQVIDFTPGFGFKITPLISVGAGLDIAYVTGEFDQNTGLGLYNDKNIMWYDASSENTGHDITYGFHLGLLLNITDDTRIGLTYHSQMSVNLHGKSSLSGSLAQVMYGNDTESNDNFKTSFRLPAWTELSFFHSFNQQWAIMASTIYTQWGSFDQLKLENVVGQTTPNDTVTIKQGFSNTWNFALGIHYKPIQSLTLKFGTGYDFSPTNDTDRNIYGPDNNRFVLAIGAAYEITDSLKIDIGYSHYFIKDAPINTTQTVNNDSITETVNGDVKSSADLFGLQLTWKFK
ncbi:outer membrane protein transport protein [Thiotrichales bacterium 19X7-9]|nr:outer membrane protein transport protein [Thiotrichales bacterium 19X7-9]